MKMKIASYQYDNGLELSIEFNINSGAYWILSKRGELVTTFTSELKAASYCASIYNEIEINKSFGGEL
jgi:hypothetical protein